MLIDWKTQCYKDIHTLQFDLQIQCSSKENLNSIFFMELGKQSKGLYITEIILKKKNKKGLDFPDISVDWYKYRHIGQWNRIYLPGFILGNERCSQRTFLVINMMVT